MSTKHRVSSQLIIKMLKQNYINFFFFTIVTLNLELSKSFYYGVDSSELG